MSSTKELLDDYKRRKQKILTMSGPEAIEKCWEGEEEITVDFYNLALRYFEGIFEKAEELCPEEAKTVLGEREVSTME